MDMDYMEFLAWVDRCILPIDLGNELKELGLPESLTHMYVSDWRRWVETETYKFGIIYLYQCYCVGGRPPEEKVTEVESYDV